MQETIRVLVVDDEEPFRRLLKKELLRKGFVVETASDGDAALEMLKGSIYHVVLLDIVMPGMDGMTFMEKLKTDPSLPAVIVLTGKATVETAVDAMKKGVFDYITKPYKLDELIIVINRAYEFGKLRVQTRLLQQELLRKESPFELICSSRKMKDILVLIKKIAPTDSPVLIQGESGTGKELIANAIWHFSRRSGFPIIALNCATLSESLIESELFGHEKGAFTNAYHTKHGIVEVADKGTLFLDEIGEMPLTLQAKLLRFLDSGEFRRVGGNKTLGVNVRVIAATNTDLSGRVREGRFREDLFYRLNVISLTVPPLRERKEDIADLSNYFMRKYAVKLAKSVSVIADEATEVLRAYDWPGNVRELENVIERAVILCEAGRIRPEDLSVRTELSSAAELGQVSLGEVEKNYILKVLGEVGGNQTIASQILGIDRKTLYLRLKKYGLI